MSKGILLDTHTWIWLCEGAKELKPAIVSRIHAAAKVSELNLSVISVWEVGVLAMKRKAVFEPDVESWVAEALNLSGLSLEPITPQIALSSSNLPGTFHGDPPDRIVVATARANNLLLLTRDRAIISYSKQGHARCLQV